MLEVDEAEFDRLMAVNVKPIFLFARAVVPLMRAKRAGVIINIGSTAGIRPRPGLTWYNASKGAVNLLSKSMAAELAPDGIRVCAVAPVVAETGPARNFPWRGYAASARTVSRQHSAEAIRQCRRRGKRSPFPRLGRRLLPHRQRSRGGRRALRVAPPTQVLRDYPLRLGMPLRCRDPLVACRDVESPTQEAR
jgi:NAD(P)-dependent dehydrogenase (short-subunit alcohol dehydrogenase family)